MKIQILKNDRIIDFILPKEVHGNYWVTDKGKDGKERNFINIIEEDGKWQMLSNYEVAIYDEGYYKENVFLTLNKFYILKIDKEEDTLLYCTDVYDDSTIQLMVKKNAEITIGSKDSCQIDYTNKYIKDEHAKLIYKDNEWYVSAISNDALTYVNGERINSKKLSNGDIIYIMGLKIVVIKNNIILNNINKIKVDGSIFTQSSYPKQNIKPTEENDDEIELYDDNDYFFKAPRFRNNPGVITMNIDPAPQKQEEDKTPLLMSIGSMLTMGMTSAVSAFTSINSVVANGHELKEALPSIIMAIAMLCTMFLWPLINRRYNKKQVKKAEKERKEKYTAYIESKRNEVKAIMKIQTEALNESFPALDELKKIIMFRRSNLWEREKDQDDFLKVRIGTGTLPVGIDIHYPEEHFSMSEDDLKKEVDKLMNDSKDLENVPITVSFAEKYISALVGETPTIENICHGIILQLIANHSYDDLKLVFFTKKEKAHYWDFAKTLPHCFSDDKSMRYYALNADDMKQISSSLESVFAERAFKDDSGTRKDGNFKSYKNYYLIITDDFKTARDIEIVKEVLDQKINYGFSILVLNDKLTNLPNECMNFICVGHNGKSVIFEDELVTNKQKKFTADIDETIDLNEYAVKLANIPIDNVKNEVSFPKSVSFLEMYNVGKVEQLNSYNRWQTNIPINSLQAPLGLDKQGNVFKLDLHEKFHGPHGLIAGMTGSGKSELIISYILSLAVNYHPYEVSFIIIDYKGGGVAKAFENKEVGRKLPHIAGTITNLDTAEMNRALTSIESELRRRQKIFNEAREIANESTIDIYKYQKLYRNGVVKEPVSHLFIICDEFAELKTSEPEFMDQLISTSRIGRSLGVHLILATQKPAGVVNDQIWANSRFRICLKVQEKEDSMEMIKSPVAATIKNVGRFYLQVGYNEFFAEGLAAYSGAPYIPADKPKKKRDNSINFIDNIAYVVKSVDEDKPEGSVRIGEELSNIINYIIDVAKESNIEARKLWLDKIPAELYVDDLAKKYNYVPEKYHINPIVGEYDDPVNQRQDLLTIDLSNGNAIVFGSTGNGKANFLNSLLYSTITNHDASEVNFYILDFGSEMFRVYKKAPQVGDVVFVNEVEKVGNLFKLIEEKVRERKKILADYNGDFNYYNKKSESKLPLIVIMINNYEAFFEGYQNYEDVMLRLTRDGSKFGIMFILTASATNTIRYKLRQNFKQEFVLQLNDESDYTTIFGNIHKKYPSKIFGRGLIKLDDLYEFQTCYPYNSDNVSEYIIELCDKLKSESKVFAEHIAILPDVVTIDDVNFKLKGLEGVPVGINKGTLAISNWDFKNNLSSIITGAEMSSMKFFINPFINQFSNIKDSTIIVLDALEIVNISKSDNVFVYKKDFSKMIESISNTIIKQKEIYEKNNYNKEIFNTVKPVVLIIVGLDSLFMKLPSEVKLMYSKLIENIIVTQTLKIVYIDTVDVFKKYEYEPWYKQIIKNNQAIWLGSGITDQYTIKIAKITRELQEVLDLGFGYIVKRGIPVLTKFITSEDGYRSDEDE